VNSLDHLRREPHILGWMRHLHAQVPPLATASYINRLITLRCIFNELAWTAHLPDLAHLIRRADIPRLPQRLPRPLTAQQDPLLQQEFLRRNDLGGNAFLLIRHTGMRIGECADLSFDCLRSTSPDQWPVYAIVARDQQAIHFRCAEPPTANPDKYRDELLDAYLFVEDADALYAEYAAQGVEFTRGLANMPWHSREFVVKDCDGRLLAFGANL
jgi:hypothetical protein